jgi:uncharacterized membrane protein YoaK (UPF0700 family)
MATIDSPGAHATPEDRAPALSRVEKRLPPLLSVIAGMVDLTGFISLGNLFTAHITGNLVVIGALVVRGGRVNPAQILAIPVFMLAVGAVWLFARASGKRGLALLRLLLLVQFLLLMLVLVFSVVTKPSTAPHASMADVAAMMAVSAMACQFALLRLSLPVARSTAVMTGNLTNAVLSALNTISPDKPSKASDLARLKDSVHLVIGFFAGCVAAAVAVTYLADWAWSLPTVLAGIAVAMP